MRPPVSVVFMVKDEADRLPPALASVAWADEVLVLDTGSTDGTREVARSAGARLVEAPWEGYVATRNRALPLLRHDWTLLLDADERVSDALRAEIEERLSLPNDGISGFDMPRLSHLGGRPVRHGTWYPDRKLRLARRSRGLRVEGGRVHERTRVDGPVERLESPLLHHPYRDVADAVRKMGVYARLAAEDRFEKGDRARLSSFLLRPPAELLRCLVVKRGFLDGDVGLAVAGLHAASYLLRAAFLFELERRGQKEDS